MWPKGRNATQRSPSEVVLLTYYEIEWSSLFNLPADQ